MPTPDQMQQQGQGAASTTMHRLLRNLDGTTPSPDLAYEISELRREIAELRAELAPVPSLILTGKQAIDDFKRITRCRDGFVI